MTDESWKLVTRAEEINAAICTLQRNLNTSHEEAKELVGFAILSEIGGELAAVNSYMEDVTASLAGIERKLYDIETSIDYIG